MKWDTVQISADCMGSMPFSYRLSLAACSDMSGLDSRWSFKPASLRLPGLDPTSPPIYLTSCGLLFAASPACAYTSLEQLQLSNAGTATKPRSSPEHLNQLPSWQKGASVLHTNLLGDAG